MTYRLVYNTGDTSVVVDDTTGRSVGGAEWGTARLTDYVRSLISTNELVEIKNEPGEDANPQAVEAAQRTASWNEKAATLEAHDADHVRDLGTAAGLDVDELTRPEIERLLVETEEPLPVLDAAEAEPEPETDDKTEKAPAKKAASRARTTTATQEG